jgi:hypothetical protein
MNENKESLNYININVNKFHTFLDRFSQFDENLLLEITPDEFYSRTYTPDRSAIKYSALKLEEILQVNEEYVPDNLKVGIINVKHYQQALKFLESSDNVSMSIKYLKLAGLDIEEEYVAMKTTLNNNKDLQFSFENGSLSIYGIITNDKFFNEISNIPEPIFEFDLSLEDLTKIKKFSNIDKINNDIYAEYRENSVIFGNKNFEYKLSSQNNKGNANISACFPKNYLNMLDHESYNVKVGHTKLIFMSLDSKTILVVGRNDSK